jgi:hypothetical protein
MFSEPLALGRTHRPCTVRTDDAPKVRFSATLEESEVDVALV